MTVVVSHVSTMTGWGGVERMLADLFMQATPSRFTHTLLTTSCRPEIIASIARPDLVTFQPRRSFRYSPEAIWQMVQWLRQERVEVVHGYNTPAGVWAGVAAMMARTPVFIGGEHGTAWTVAGPMAWLTRWMYHRAQQVIANSEATRLLLCRRFGLDSDRVQVVPNAVTQSGGLPEQSENPFKRGDELIVGSVGRLASPKNFGLLVEAAALVLHHDARIRFVLIGGGGQEAALTAKIDQLGLQDRFILAGSHDDAKSLVRYFDIFVSTSLHESFGNVLLEAAMMGKPVIAPRVDGIPEAVVDGQTGVLLTPDVLVDRASMMGGKLPRFVVINGRLSPPKTVSPPRLAEAILQLADDPQTRQRMGEAGRDHARQFTFTRYQARLEAVYAKSLEATVQ